MFPMTWCVLSPKNTPLNLLSSKHIHRFGHLEGCHHFETHPKANSPRGVRRNDSICIIYKNRLGDLAALKYTKCVKINANLMCHSEKISQNTTKQENAKKKKEIGAPFFKKHPQNEIFQQETGLLRP